MRQEIINKVLRYTNKGYPYTITEAARQIGVTQPCLFNLVHDKRVGSVATLEKIEAWVPKAPKRRKR